MFLPLDNSKNYKKMFELNFWEKYRSNYFNFLYLSIASVFMCRYSMDFINARHRERKYQLCLRFYKMNMIGNRETDARYACVIGTVWLRLMVGPPWCFWLRMWSEERWKRGSEDLWGYRLSPGVIGETDRTRIPWGSGENRVAFRRRPRVPCRLRSMQCMMHSLAVLSILGDFI